MNHKKLHVLETNMVTHIVSLGASSLTLHRLTRDYLVNGWLKLEPPCAHLVFYTYSSKSTIMYILSLSWSWYKVVALSCVDWAGNVNIVAWCRPHPTAYNTCTNFSSQFKIVNHCHTIIANWMPQRTLFSSILSWKLPTNYSKKIFATHTY